MISACKCLYNTELKATYIHGIVVDQYDVCERFDEKRHEIIASPLDYQIIGFRVFYNHMKRRGVSRFTKMRLFKEDLCVQMMFRHMNIFTSCIESMIKYQILTRDGRSTLVLGTKP